MGSLKRVIEPDYTRFKGKTIRCMMLLSICRRMDEGEELIHRKLQLPKKGGVD
jgi:hypothetical protein